jgi:hypothetical protein
MGVEANSVETCAATRRVSERPRLPVEYENAGVAVVTNQLLGALQ